MVVDKVLLFTMPKGGLNSRPQQNGENNFKMTKKKMYLLSCSNRRPSACKTSTLAINYEVTYIINLAALIQNTVALIAI